MIAISGSSHHYEIHCDTKEEEEYGDGQGVCGGVCVNQDIEQLNIFGADSQRLLNDPHLRFDSMNLALWS